MLFLRRAGGESITLLGPRGFHHLIYVTSVSVTGCKACLTIPELGHRTMRQGDSLEIFHGLIRLKLSGILDYRGVYPSAATLGIEAPREIRIHRTERLTGLGADQLRAMSGE